MFLTEYGWIYVTEGKIHSFAVILIISRLDFMIYPLRKSLIPLWKNILILIPLDLVPTWKIQLIYPASLTEGIVLFLTEEPSPGDN